MKRKPKLKSSGFPMNGNYGIPQFPEGGINYPVGFDPNTGVHNLGPGQQPLTDDQLTAIGFQRFNPNSSRAAQEGDRGWYKVNPYNPATYRAPGSKPIIKTLPMQPEGSTTSAEVQGRYTTQDKAGNKYYFANSKPVSENEYNGYYKNLQEIPQFGYGGIRYPKAAFGMEIPLAIENDPNYNPDVQDPKRDYSQYMTGAAAGLAGAGTAYAGTEGSSSDKSAAAANGGIDAIAGTVTPWYGLAKGASNLGKSMIKGDTVTDPRTGEVIKQGKSDNGQAMSDTFTPLHETVINDFKNGDAGRGALDVVTGGVYNTLDNYFNHTNKNKYDSAQRAIVEANKKPFVSDKDYRQDAVWQKLNDHPQFERGGILPDYAKYPFGGMPNAEVEKQEVMMAPDGTTAQVNGPSHEQGGIPVNLPQGTQIFSDKLKLPGSKKTIAKEAAKFMTNKEDKVLEDDNATLMAKNTAKLVAKVKQSKLSQLFQAQEAMKMSRVAKYAEKMGIDLSSMGGARNTGKPEFAGGGLQPMDLPEDPTLNNHLMNSHGYYAETPDNRSYNQDRTMNILEGVSNGLIQNAGNFYDLYQSGFGKKYDREEYTPLDAQYVNPKTLDATESLRDADREATANRRALKDNVGGNAGAYMANLVANQNANTLNKAKIRESINNTNTGILNSADSINTGIKNDFAKYNADAEAAAYVAEQQNKARSEDMAAHAVRDMGSKFASSYADYKAGDIDQKKLALINQYFPDYKFDPKTYEMYFRAANDVHTKSKKR